MKSARSVVMLFMTVMFVATLSACEKKEVATDDKGPAERAGERIDQAAARAGEELNKAAEKTGEGLKQLGQKLQNEAEEAEKKE